MISLVLDRPFHRLQNDILDSYERFIFYVGFYFGKMWKILEKRPFFRADMAGLGSIGLRFFLSILEMFAIDSYHSETN